MKINARNNIFRIDRLITLFLANPVVRRFYYPLRKEGIAILMYHGISDDLEMGVHPYFKINTSPKIFSRHMHYLTTHGYHSISLQEIASCIRNHRPFPSKSVVISFDDGLRSFYTHAFPALKKYGQKAIMFLPTAFIRSHQNQRDLELQKYLTWDEIQSMHQDGMVFGSHTVNHYRLISLDRDSIGRQLAKSRQVIEEKLNTHIDAFSYPYKFPEQDNRFVKILIDLLIESGYSCGVSTRIGTTGLTDSIFFMRRLPINSYDDIPLFKAKLEGYYNWLHSFQYISKVFRNK